MYLLYLRAGTRRNVTYAFTTQSHARVHHSQVRGGRIVRGERGSNDVSVQWYSVYCARARYIIDTHTHTQTNARAHTYVVDCTTSNCNAHPRKHHTTALAINYSKPRTRRNNTAAVPPFVARCVHQIVLRTPPPVSSHCLPNDQVRCITFERRHVTTLLRALRTLRGFASVRNARYVIGFDIGTQICADATCFRPHVSPCHPIVHPPSYADSSRGCITCFPTPALSTVPVDARRTVMSPETIRRTRVIRATRRTDGSVRPIRRHVRPLRANTVAPCEQKIIYTPN